jgi:flap endonuclease-1
LGVNLGDLIKSEKVKIEDLKGKTIAFDGHNNIYQFLAIIRGRQGKPLKDIEGNITSHLSGLIYRNSNLVEAGIKVAYVFDGSPHRFKKKVLLERKKTRQEAEKKYVKAISEDDEEGARRYGQRAVVATKNIIDDAKTLLDLMGIPWIQAPGEGEAQTAYMTQKGDISLAASQDYDSLLYGAKRLIRNISITGRRKLPRKNVYVRIDPQYIVLEKLLESLGLSREQLVEVGILLGTDYNPEGIRGIGPKTAYKLIKEHGSLAKALPYIKKADFPYPPEEIKNLFTNPPVTNNYNLKWKQPDKSGILDFLCKRHNFNPERVMKAIIKLEKGFKRNQERTTLDCWFS